MSMPIKRWKCCWHFNPKRVRAASDILFLRTSLIYKGEIKYEIHPSDVTINNETTSEG